MAIERALVLWLACFAPPAEPWQEGDDLPSCGTVCRPHVRKAEEASSTADILVIDLDALPAGAKRIEVGHGIVVEFAPSERSSASSGQEESDHQAELWVTVVEGDEETCEQPLPADVELRPVPMEELPGRLADRIARWVDTEEELLPVMEDEESRPLPTAEAGRRDVATADFQRNYARLQAEGRRQEAEALAVRFLADDGSSRPAPGDHLPRRVEHQVGYRATPGRWVRTYPGTSSSSWSEVSHRRITVRFEGTSIDELASFLRWATGLSVDVELSASQAELLRCYVACNDATLSEAVAAIARSLSISIEPAEDRLILREQSGQ